jgi:hypothetical protein
MLHSLGGLSIHHASLVQLLLQLHLVHHLRLFQLWLLLLL